MSEKFRFKVVVCLLLILAFPPAGLAQEPTVISASPNRLLLDGWDMVLPDIEGPYKNTDMTVVKYTLPNGTVKKFAMRLPPDIPFMWTKRDTNELLDSPPGYPKYYTQQLLDWWHNGGRGNYLNKNGVWVAMDGSASSLAPPVIDSETTPPVLDPAPINPPPVSPNKPDEDPRSKRANELNKIFQETRQRLGPGHPDTQAAQKAYIDYITGSQ